jgi:hypothetical protein
MANIFQPDKNAKDNIVLFLATIADQDLRDLLILHTDDILRIGSLAASDEISQNSRDAFFGSIESLIQSRM